MSTLRSQYLKVVRRVSPYDADGVKLTSANLDSLDPEGFTKERVLDAYNEARRVLFNALANGIPEPQLGEQLKELLHTDSLIVTVDKTIIKGEGYIRLKRLYNNTRSRVVEQVEQEMEDVLSRNPKYVPAQTRQFVIDRGDTLKIYGADQGESVLVRYYRLIDHTLAGLESGVNETYNQMYHPALVSVTEAILLGDGQVDPMGVAQLFVRGEK